MVTNRWSMVTCMLGGLLLSGCLQSSSSTSSSSSGSSSTKSAAEKAGSSANTDSKGQARTGYWEDYPDVPKVEIMTEMAGIKIPRVKISDSESEATGPIPVDIGNNHAKKSGTPVDGDSLTIRFNSEPKVLNHFTENSAVSTMILKYVFDDLAKQNFETFEFEPKIAKSWKFEDSVKLASNFAGRERKVTIVDGVAPSASDPDDLVFEYKIPAATGDKPADGPKITFKTADKDGNSLGRVWVGLFPVEKTDGAPATGFHYWSDDSGQLVVSDIAAGKYSVKTGDEVFGTSEAQDDGSLKISPATEENPLKEPLTLKKGEWQDIQKQTYATFYLRNDVTWSDGTPFTTKDIEFGYALLENQYVDCDAIRIYYQDVIECKALSPHKVRFRSRKQYFKANEILFEFTSLAPPFHLFAEQTVRKLGRDLVLTPLAAGEDASKKQISALSQEFGKFFNTNEEFNNKPLGTGPYIVDKWERKDRLELVRNPNYWDRPSAGHLDRIIVKFIPDQVTAFTALKAGEVDFLYRMSSDQFFEDWKTLDAETRDSYVKASWFSPAMSYVGWNELAKPFQDARVRLAMTLLFDRQEFIEKKLHGTAKLVSGYQYYYGIGYDHEVAPIGYDPEKARELLTDAGWFDTDNDGILDKDGEAFRVTLRTAKGSPIVEAMCEAIQRNLKDVGIDLQIQTMEWASFTEKLRSKECDVVTLAWALNLEGDSYQIWHSSGAARENRGSNSISFRNSQADELIELLRVTLDEKKRKRIHQSFHRLLDREQPYMFLWMPREFSAYHHRFRNVKWYRIRPGFDLTEWYVPKEEQRR